MPKGKPREWPPDSEILKQIAAKGIAAYAREIGVPYSSLHHKAERIGYVASEDKANTPTPTGEVSEIEMLRQRVQELERDRRKDRKGAVMDERITQAVESAVHSRKPIYKSKAKPRVAKTDEHEFVLLWSDTHAGEVVSLEETNGINSYDWDTMLGRMGKMRDSLISYQENRPYKIKKLHVLALGDMLSGDIHDELVTTNEIPLAEATVQFGMDGAEWLESLTEHFPEIRFAGVVGNHPRAHKKPWAKLGYDNADWTAMHIMSLWLRRNDRITFEIPRANQHLIEVAQRWRLLLWHGDSVRSSMPGVPWGGVMRRANALQAAYTKQGKPVDMFVCGHFHNPALVQSDAGQVAINGSVKGIDEYSLKAFGGGRPAQQMLLTFHPKRGLTDVSMLDLEGGK